MSKETFYFSHDYNARSDSKIKKLISKQGLLGYGIYWAIIEDLYNNDNSIPYDLESLSFDLRQPVEIVEDVLNNYDLLWIKKNTISSNSVEYRLQKRKEKSEKARESAGMRWNKKQNANAMRTHSDSNAIKESKVKDIKENNIVQNEILNDTDFIRFWDLYGKKIGKEKSFKLWKKLNNAEKDKIFELLPAYVKNTPDKAYRKNPDTYLRNKCWNDEIIEKHVNQTIKLPSTKWIQ